MTKNYYLKAKIHGEMLNRMFGGQCGHTALALMQMLPMPFEHFKKEDFNSKTIDEFIKALYYVPPSENYSQLGDKEDL